MRYSKVAVVSLIVTIAGWTAAAAAAEAVEPIPVAQADSVATEESADQPAPVLVVTPELVDAHRDYQLARMRWQQYRLVELPRQRRALADQTRLLDAEARVLRRRVRDYRPFLEVGRYSPARTAAENDRLALVSTEQRLRQLREERINAMRFSGQQAQLYELDVLRAALRLRELVAEATAARP